MKTHRSFRLPIGSLLWTKRGDHVKFLIPHIQIAYFLVVQPKPTNRTLLTALRHEIGLGFGQGGGMLRVRLILKSFVVKLNSQSLLSSAMQLVGHILKLCNKKSY